MKTDANRLEISVNMLQTILMKILSKKLIQIEFN